MAKADEDPEYQVFINYRSVDTRRYFASHLHNALQAKKMRPFMFEFVKDAGESAFSSWDAEEQNLLPVIRKALRDSKISVVIFSREYASSTYCLEELVIIQECRRKGQVVIPVFYDVSPAAVQKLAEGYGTWFARYEETMKESVDKVRQWKAALTEIAGLIGWSSSPYRECCASIRKTLMVAEESSSLEMGNLERKHLNRSMLDVRSTFRMEMGSIARMMTS